MHLLQLLLNGISCTVAQQLTKFHSDRERRAVPLRQLSHLLSHDWDQSYIRMLLSKSDGQRCLRLAQKWTAAADLCNSHTSTWLQQTSKLAASSAAAMTSRSMISGQFIQPNLSVRHQCLLAALFGINFYRPTKIRFMICPVPATTYSTFAYRVALLML